MLTTVVPIAIAILILVILWGLRRPKLAFRPSHTLLSSPDVSSLDLPISRCYFGPDIVPTRIRISEQSSGTSLGPIQGARTEFVEHRLGTPLVVAVH
jgi:hypothetical protein